MAATPEAAAIKGAAKSLAELPEITAETLAEWAGRHPREVPALGLTVGLSQEKLKNALRHHLGTSGWITLALQRADELIDLLDREFDLIRLVNVQRDRKYDFGDLLVARSGTRGTAARAGASGRRVEDDIEAIVDNVGVPYEVRTRFTGRRGETAPCDVAVPTGATAEIAVAAKGFDSTGSKLTDAVREIERMATVRLPTQFIMAVVDGIGWKSRVADLRRIHELWVQREIDGMYTLATLDNFRADIVEACTLRGLIV
ncbi:MAG TPA: hypothetical protein VFJ14_10585 [Nocardioidaceae bacterium]|nr:hypothetical protein [Nocardioidaceae bacterium]